jgi:hypothetical protein
MLEALMLASFGVAWPAAIHRSWTTRAVGSKSLPFLLLVALGYAAGLANKLLHHRDYVIAFYALNLAMVLTECALYARNKRLSKGA